VPEHSKPGPAQIWRSVDPASQRDLHLLRRELERNRDAGTPWGGREALDVIAILDTPTWACLCGLLLH